MPPSIHRSHGVPGGNLCVQRMRPGRSAALRGARGRTLTCRAKRIPAARGPGTASLASGSPWALGTVGVGGTSGDLEPGRMPRPARARRLASPGGDRRVSAVRPPAVSFRNPVAYTNRPHDGLRPLYKPVAERAWAKLSVSHEDLLALSQCMR
eukprot:scaffold1220_cov376-Prasinococcus_capsulatus_cf.AAC.1